MAEFTAKHFGKPVCHKIWHLHVVTRRGVGRPIIRNVGFNYVLLYEADSGFWGSVHGKGPKGYFWGRIWDVPL